MVISPTLRCCQMTAFATSRMPMIKFPRRMKVKPGAGEKLKPFIDVKSTVNSQSLPNFTETVGTVVSNARSETSTSKKVVIQSAAIEESNLPKRYARKLISPEEMEYIEKGGQV